MTELESETPVEAVLPEQIIKRRGYFLELLRFAIITALIVLPIRFFIAQPFIVSGDSMIPTFESGQYLIVDEISYRFTVPERGDIIIFRHPSESGRILIKRIIGLPSETVTVEGDNVTIKNSAHPDGLKLTEPYISSHSVFGKVEANLNADQYFVLGDNRPNSLDSRFFGPIERKMIIGRPLFRLLPVGTLATFPGANQEAI